MYKELHDLLMDDMMHLGIVKTISISEDLFSKLSPDEVYKLEGMMECSSRIKWIIRNDCKKHISFIYTQYPIRKNEKENNDIRT